MRVDLRGDPQPEELVTVLGLHDGEENLVQVVQTQVTVLEKRPASLERKRKADVITALLHKSVLV